MATIKDIVIDSPYPAKLARFWAAALDDHQVLPYDDEEVTRLAALGRTPETDPTVAVVGPGPSLFFNEVATPEGGKNRLHLDLQTSQREREVARLVALGASVCAVHPEWTVLADPDGNEFCVHGDADLYG